MKVLVKFFLNNKKVPIADNSKKGSCPGGTHPNFCFAKTPFMLETLDEIFPIEE